MFLTCVEGVHFEFFKSTGTHPTTPEKQHIKDKLWFLNRRLGQL